MTSALKPSPKPGQYWAREADTCLCYVTEFWPGDNYSTVSIKTWTGYDFNPDTFVLPATGLLWLWHETHIDRALIPWDMLPGDVGIHMPTRQLFFIGPGTDRHLVHILSDWYFEKDHIRLFYAIRRDETEGVALVKRLSDPIV